MDKIVSRTRCSVLDDAPQSRDPHFIMRMGPGSAAHHAATAARCAASGARASVLEMSQKFNSPVRSRQSGLSFSIEAIFHARRQRFKECSLARVSRDGIEGFKIDELIDFILPCETGNKLGFMLRQTPSEIVGDADIQRPISLTCENVDKERRVHCLSCLGSAMGF